ncbi:minor tail protein [Streptomyces phage RedBear]|nr:minor tail protein [Streptomyces phage RedBear]QZE10726.1 minor tail protein [Streptomyces phage Katalie]
MTQSSYPFDAQTVSETQYSQFFRELQDSGVCAQTSDLDLRVGAAGTGMTVTVQPGRAILRGHAYSSTAVETLTIAASESQSRTDRVILRLDPTANTIVLAVLKGTAGGGFPALNQTDTGVYELLLANVTVGANVTVITSGNVSRQRSFVGHRTGHWETEQRPSSPRLGKLGYNFTTNRWEFWDGSAWTDLAPIVDYSTLANKPSSFPPSDHSHAWADITSKPTTFPPSAHTHPAPAWNDVTSKPTTFAPSSHSHDWASITSKPSTFTPSGHSHSWGDISGKPSQYPPTDHWHGQYLEGGDTIAWANGSKQPHARSVSGSGTYYAVWVRGDGGFCKNTSSLRFKQNVRDHDVNADAVLNLRPVVYDRLPDEEGGDYARDEFGLVAEEVHEHLPEIVTRDEDGRIDTVRYDLLGVALLPVVQRQAKQIEDLEARLARLEAKHSGTAE